MDFVFSSAGEAFFCHQSWHTLQEPVACITSNAAAETRGDAPLDAPPAARVVVRHFL